MTDKIKTYSQYGDPRKQAQEGFAPQASDSGLTPAQAAETRSRLESFESRLMSRDASLSPNREALLKDELPQGSALMPNKINSSRKTANMPMGINFGSVSNNVGNNGTGTYLQSQRPYQPEFDDISRLSYPVHRILANRYWRLFHKLDPIIGTGIDILSEMWVSKFQLSGEGIDGSIKQAYESQIEETQLMGILPYFSREYWVTGEAIPHLIFDDAKGYWVHVSLHNPDQMEIIDAPFLHMDPVMEFVPDDRLRQIVSSSDPALVEVRKSIPAELTARIQSGQNIPLDSLNVTFLPRKLHPYDSRGTGIISRLWRVLMFEDAIFSASIAEARRHANPIKVVKLGNERTGWIPGVQAEAKMADLIAKAELDSQAWIITHYGVAFEQWGTTGKGVQIERSLDTIERIKLLGLGIPKAVVVGEATYASSEKGLQVLLQRLKTFRNMVESRWLIPKFFRNVAKMNNWVKTPKSELKHGYRIKRSASELRDIDYIVPTIEWETPLSPRVDADMQKAIEGLERLGLKISRNTKAATVAGLDYEQEQKKVAEEEIKDQELAEAKAEAKAEGEAAEAEKLNIPVPFPPQSVNEEIAAPLPPVGTSEVQPPLPPTNSLEASSISRWEKTQVAPLVEYLNGNPDPMIDSDFWKSFYRDEALIDSESKWNAVDDYLVKEGYLDSEINNLHSLLVEAGVLHDPLKEAMNRMPEDAGLLSDSQFDALLDKPEIKSELKKKSRKVKKT